MKMRKGEATELPQEPGETKGVLHHRRLDTWALAALLFFNVSGGPIGTEGLVSSVGPLYSILGFLILPFFWCFPVGLMTAELSTAISKDGGYVIWVDMAFGRFAGFMMGWMSWASGVIDNALYPGMFVAFMQDSLGWNFSPHYKEGIIFMFNTVMTCTNVVGLEVVGTASIIFCILVLLPVAVLIIACFPSMKVSAWAATKKHPDWVMWINLMLWNTSGFDATSTVGSEVVDPGTTYPKAILISQFLVVAPYLLMLLAATAVDQNFGEYENGTYNAIAIQQGGYFLGALFTIGTVAGVMGMYVSDMTCYAYQLSGMAEEGMVPRVLATQLPRFETPIVSIAVCFIFVQVISQLPFQEILVCDNFLYAICLLLELASVVKLRMSHPDLERPFRIPLSTLPLALLMLIPASFCFFILFTSTARVLCVAGGIALIGVIIFFLNSLCKPDETSPEYMPLL
mmetsp:Transcript_27085/g.55143  ORF Transcript_27085/g.55143 Transcript_27085/m.55143 type:complete len:456 (+) Transcript_27085:120-1487(+)